jgi:hypothetical protein
MLRQMTLFVGSKNRGLRLETLNRGLDNLRGLSCCGRLLPQALRVSCGRYDGNAPLPNGDASSGARVYIHTKLGTPDAHDRRFGAHFVGFVSREAIHLVQHRSGDDSQIKRLAGRIENDIVEANHGVLSYPDGTKGTRLKFGVARLHAELFFGLEIISDIGEKLLAVTREPGVSRYEGDHRVVELRHADRGRFPLPRWSYRRRLSCFPVAHRRAVPAVPERRMTPWVSRRHTPSGQEGRRARVR